jgi:hypothetical protein
VTQSRFVQDMERIKRADDVVVAVGPLYVYLIATALGGEAMPPSTFSGVETTINS